MLYSKTLSNGKLSSENVLCCMFRWNHNKQITLSTIKNENSSAFNQKITDYGTTWLRQYGILTFFLSKTFILIFKWNSIWILTLWRRNFYFNWSMITKSLKVTFLFKYSRFLRYIYCFRSLLLKVTYGQLFV